MSGAKRLFLVGGGARSGKSSFATSLAERLGARRHFIATAKRIDEEMTARIERHVRDRGGAFTTTEEPVALAAALRAAKDADVVVVDCLTLWLTNLMFTENLDDDGVLARVDEVVEVLRDRTAHVILVTNEVGMSLHAPTAIGRRYTDLCGFMHQRFARAADEVYLAVLGTIVRVAPVRVEDVVV